MRPFALAFVLVGIWAHATDLTELEINQVMNNVSHEYTTCSAYFSIVAAAATRSGDEDTGADLQKASNTALEYAATAAKFGRSDEMALKVVEARLGIEADGMMSEIENDAANISLLFAKHNGRCVSIMNDAEGLLKEWTKEIESRR